MDGRVPISAPHTRQVLRKRLCVTQILAHPALFTTAKMGKQPKCPSAGERMTTFFLSARGMLFGHQKNEVLIVDEA